MARKYVCDKCGSESKTWNTTYVDFPAEGFLGNKLLLELCSGCLSDLKKIVKEFMKEKE